MTARLPQPGSDDNTWGDVLNDYLSVSHNANGTLKLSAIASKADDAFVVHTTTNESIGGVKTFTLSPIVPAPTSNTDAANKQYVDSTISTGAPDAGATTKGLVKLAGDLGGTADTPTVPGLTAKEPSVASGTTGQYYRGDKSWQTLDKAAVGLSNLDNTSDANKPVSTAVQTALNGKADKATLTTKGDIYVATAASSPVRVGVGSDGQVLTADSGQSVGVKWSTPSAGLTTAAATGLSIIFG